MKTSLANNYQVKLLRERLKHVDQQLIIESQHATMLIEAMDEADLKKAETIINKLRQMSGKGMDNLDASIKQAITDVNRYTEGNPLTVAWSKLKSVAGLDNPLAKILTFANALEKGFSQMDVIVKNNLGDDVDTEKSIVELGLDEKAQKTLINTMRRALSPGGFFSVFKNVPYIKKDALISDLLQVQIKNILTVSQIAKSGIQAQTLADDMKDVMKSGDSAQTKGTEETTPAEGGEGTTGTKTTKGTLAGKGTAAAGEKATAGAKKASPEDVRRFLSQNAKGMIDQYNAGLKKGENPGVALRYVLDYLNDKGALNI